MDFAWNLRSTAVLELLTSELGLTINEGNNFDIWEYVAVENNDDLMLAQLSSVVRYIAAVRVLKARNLFKDEREIILTDKNIWNDELKSDYEGELESVKGELIKKSLELIDKYPQWTEDMMKRIYS